MINKNYMSIGYPIGLCKDNRDDDNTLFYKVENGGILYSLSLNAYNLWKTCFFDVKNSENFRNIYIDKYKLSDKEFNKNKKDLIDNKLLIEFSTLDELLLKIGNFTTIKNGYGLGLKDNTYEAIIINQNQEFKILYEEFNLWSLSNNRKSINSFVNYFKEIYKIDNDKNFKTDNDIKMIVINIILRLKALDLLRISCQNKEGQ